ncbi:MAG: MBL fold metallo-hydrolase [Verrucomicrobia bacterium]|nr:MBL fold metallo-hydrolase [Verrucomicrobiota bacterium]
MIKPFHQDRSFIADVEQVDTESEDIHLWWLGQSGFLVRWRGKQLLLDPYLSDSLTKKYANTDKPHVRMTERIVSPEALSFIDVVTSSHNHTDHLDAETLIPILKVNPGVSFILPEANRDFAANRLGIDPGMPIGLDVGMSAEMAGFKITAVPAAHEDVEKDSAGRCRFLGYVIEAGPWTLYHSGDTVFYNGIVEALSGWKIDVCLLPINGRLPDRKVAGNLNGSEAALLAKKIEARLVIPCHFEMFQFNTASSIEFEKVASELNQPYRVLRCGEQWSSEEISCSCRPPDLGQD